MLDPICEIAWPIHNLRKSGSSLNPFPTISRVSHKYIDHLCLCTWALQGVAEHFRRFPSLAKNVCRFYVLEMRFGGHFEVSPKHGRSRQFLHRRAPQRLSPYQSSKPCATLRALSRIQRFSKIQVLSTS